MLIGAAELPSVVCQEMFNGQFMLLLKRQNIVVENGRSSFGLSGNMQESEGMAAPRVHDHMHCRLCRPFERSDKERVLIEQFSWFEVLNVTFSEQRILLVNKSNLLSGHFDRLFSLAFSMVNHRS